MGKRVNISRVSRHPSKMNKTSRTVSFNQVTQTDSGNEMSTNEIVEKRIKSNELKPSKNYLIQNIGYTSNQNRQQHDITHFQTKHEHITAKFERDNEKGTNKKWKIEYVDENGNQIANPDWKIKSINKKTKQATWCDTAGAICALSFIAFGLYSTINAGKTRRLKKSKTKRRY
jgi:hypothetical protein